MVVMWCGGDVVWICRVRKGRRWVDGEVVGVGGLDGLVWKG